VVVLAMKALLLPRFLVVNSSRLAFVKRLVRLVLVHLDSNAP
jgi:hypothetical protein